MRELYCLLFNNERCVVMSDVEIMRKGVNAELPDNNDFVCACRQTYKGRGEKKESRKKNGVRKGEWKPESKGQGEGGREGGRNQEAREPASTPAWAGLAAERD